MINSQTYYKVFYVTNVLKEILPKIKKEIL